MEWFWISLALIAVLGVGIVVLIRRWEKKDEQERKDMGVD